MPLRLNGRWHLLIWPCLVTVVALPIAVAAASPLLAWREPVYIAAGFAGVIAMAFLLLQPLLVAGYLPGLRGIRGRQLHYWAGAGLLVAVVLHVAGLWITSPPDVIDALLLRSPTPFSLWGVIALWAVLGAALLGVFRRRFHLRLQLWRFLHSALAGIVVIGSIIHALQIDGTMGTLSKIMLCVTALVATVSALVKRKSWVFLSRGKP